MQLRAPDPGWADTKFVESQVSDADPVGEPGRVGYLVERIHADRALSARQLESPGQTALDDPVVMIQIVDELALGRLRGHVAAVVDAGDRQCIGEARRRESLARRAAHGQRNAGTADQKILHRLLTRSSSVNIGLNDRFRSNPPSIDDDSAASRPKLRGL